ncbi:MAG: carboxypeptidase regulatory-like domain-containing protein [Nitrospirae bacterium]|nr:carboxypeptidase regulatory-like domain-containing protein [Candidatus Manganitrophaceae bacterium]
MNRSFFLILLLLLTTGSVFAAELNGRVVEATGGEGISDLTVRLIPPKATKRPEKVTTTNDRGEFQFPNLDAGHYLLEVSQGTTLLDREVVEAGPETNKEIRLTRKGR